MKNTDYSNQEAFNHDEIIDDMSFLSMYSNNGTFERSSVMRKVMCAVIAMMLLCSFSCATASTKRIWVAANMIYKIGGIEYRAPKKCVNCGQSSAFILECGGFDRWTGSVSCSVNVYCSKRTSLYKTKYVCPECNWNTYSGTHVHMEYHTICSNVLLCPF